MRLQKSELAALLVGKHFEQCCVGAPTKRRRRKFGSLPGAKLRISKGPSGFQKPE